MSSKHPIFQRYRRNQIFQVLFLVIIISFGVGWYHHVRTQGAATIKSGAGLQTAVVEGPSAAAADFQADLTHTLDLQRGQGKPTFTRSDGADRRATVTDWEGRIIPVKNGEARFQGARRVENFFVYSEDFTNAAWGVGNVNNPKIPNSTDITAPDGTHTACKWVLNDNSGSRAFAQSVVPGGSVAGRTFAFSFWVYIPSSNSAGSFNMYMYSASDIPAGIAINLNALPRNVWKRVTFIYTFTSLSNTTISAQFHSNSSSTVGDMMYVWHPQIEEVSGQSNQNPSKYVSTNVLTSAPYHGANVDGVQYFDTENGNTVASNVVTEATGAKIPDATLQGYLAEGTRTNLVLRSEEFDNASWTTTGLTITPNGIASPTGSVTADLVYHPDTSTIQALQSVSALNSAGTYTFSFYAKYNSIQWIRPVVYNSAGNVAVWFDIQNGVVGTNAISGSGTFVSASISSVGDGWYRCIVVGTLTTSSSGAVYVNSASVDGSNTRSAGSFYLWGAQLEQASFASSYIPTTSASVTRGNDTLTYQKNSNIDVNNGAAYAEISGINIGGRVIGGFTGANYGDPMRVAASSVRMTSGTTWLSGIGYTNSASSQRVSTKWSGTTAKTFNGGTVGNALVYDSPMNMGSSFAIGNVVSSTADPLYGTIKNVKLWKQAMSDAFLTSLTAGGTAAEKKTTINAGQNSILTNGLVGLWSFNGPDLSGTTAYDRSGNNNNGTLTNGPVPSPGRVGQALRFDGVDDYVDVGSRSNLNIGTQDFTVALWVKAPTQAIVPKILSSKGDSITAGYDIQLSSGKIVFRVADGTAQQSTSANGVSVDDNAWHHVAVVVRPGVNIIRYVDGTQNPDVQSITLNNITNSQNLFFGKSVTGYWFSGLIDEVRIYNRALSASEVADLYNRGR